MTDFTPFGEQSDTRPGRHLPDPVDGVPDWLSHSLWEWCDDAYLKSRGYVLDGRVDSAERALKLSLGTNDRYSVLRGEALGSDDAFLYLVDFILAARSDSARVTSLRRILDEAGSVWEPSNDGSRWLLTRRVDAAVRDTVEKAVDAASTKAGAYLRQAWAKVYGRNQDPSGGYRDAVRAVEAAARLIVSPTNSSATLGTMIPDLRNKPEKWEVDLRPRPAGTQNVDPVLVIADNMALIWKAQLDRHGDDDDETPLDVSSEEAETALHIATTLVHLFGSGRIRRKDGSTPR